MIMTSVVFYIFAVLAILCAFAVVLSSNSVKAALFLVATFVCCAVLWIILTSQFLGLILILVYVGAVMTLFLFVVMMLHLESTSFTKSVASYTPIAFVMSAVVFVILLFCVRPSYFGLANFPLPAAKPLDYSSVKALGQILYTQYFLAFELSAIILLVAIIASIALAFRGRQHRRAQQPAEQVKVRKKDRVKLVDLKTHQHPLHLRSNEAKQ